MKGKLNGLSLFSGYAGIDLALNEYIRPIMYCEKELYPQGIILSRIEDGLIPFAPIWNDVTSLDGRKLKGLVDIISGGFPCQDISVAGKGVGLEGKRSGLFFEIVRLAREINPTFLFLENVPAIRTRGALTVQQELSKLGYDTRWTTLSAAEVGANHKRERWFCLATNTKRIKLWEQSRGSKGKIGKSSTELRDNGKEGFMANSEKCNDGSNFTRESEGQIQQSGECDVSKDVSNTTSIGLERSRELEYALNTKKNENGKRNNAFYDSTNPATSNDTNSECERFLSRTRENIQPQIEETIRQDTSDICHESREFSDSDFSGLQEKRAIIEATRPEQYRAFHPNWWSTEPNVGRVVNGSSLRLDRIELQGNLLVSKRDGKEEDFEEIKKIFRKERIMALGNGVVPLQVKTAFEILLYGN